MTPAEQEALNVLDDLPRQLPSSKIINCLGGEDLSTEVFDMAFLLSFVFDLILT